MRSIAISEAIKNLKSGDVLVVAGKGHENTQEIGKKKEKELPGLNHIKKSKTSNIVKMR